MNLKDLFPSAQQYEQIKGVEDKLLQRRRTGLIGLIIVIAGAVIQTVALLSTGNYVESLGTFVSNLFSGQFARLPVNELVGILVLVIGFGIFFTLRYTSFLIKESREPFRYTFWVEPFKPVNETKDERFIPSVHSRFHLLHHDVRERINQRIKRFTLLEAKDLDSDGSVLSSHINISGDFAIREEVPGKWVIQVMPRVRIGPPGSPETLANSIKYVLLENTTENDKWSPVPENLFLSADKYNLIVERVYSSIATQVYRQILYDVKGKIELFPTNYLRHVALFYEAKDFERSNTLDAYDYALELYKEAERYFDMRLFKWKDTFFLRLPLLWRLEVKSQLMEARTRIGYSRCLFYRRSISALSGRYKNTLFEVESELEKAISNLIGLHNRINRRWKIDSSADKLKNNADKKIDRYKIHAALLTFPSDSALKRDRSIFDRQKSSLIDAYTVGALAYSDLNCIRKAEEYLENAKAVDPVLCRREALWLLASAEIEPKLSEKLSLLRQATEIAPDFQIAQYELALVSDLKLRVSNEISEDRVKSVIAEYDDVLMINPGNIGALAAQGYLWWLLGDLDEARKKFEEGREIKAAVRQTFIGEFNYGLARVAAEKGEFSKSCDLYLQAISADPEVGAYAPNSRSQVTCSYYVFMAQDMLERYEQFKKNVEKKIAEQTNKIKTPSGESSEKDAEKAAVSVQLNMVHSFVLNDFGNACLNYFRYSGNRKTLEDAIHAFEDAIKEYPENSVAYYNLSNVYKERRAENDEDKTLNCLEKAERLLPSWPAVLFASADLKMKRSIDEVGEIEKKIKLKNDELEKLKKEPQKKIGDQLEVGREQAFAKESEIKDSPTKVRQDKEFEPDNEQIKDLAADIETLNSELEVKRDKSKEDFKNYVDKIMKQTNFMSSSEDFKIDCDGGGVNDLCQMKIGRDALSGLNEYDIDALRTWANLLSKNTICENALKAAQTLCKHIQTNYYPDDFNAAQTLTSLAETKGIVGDEELIESKEAIRAYFAFILDMDPSNYVAISWARNLWSVEDWKKAIKSNSYNAEYHYGLAEAYRKNKQWKNAIDAYKEAIDIEPKNAEYHYGLAEAYRKNKQWKNAIDAYKEAIDIEPKNAEYRKGIQLVLNDEGNDYFDKANYLMAIEKYKEAITVGPKDAVIQSNLAGGWEHLKKPGQRLEDMNNAIESLNVALELATENNEYKSRLKNLENRKAILMKFGEPTLNLVQAAKPINVEMTQSLIPCILSAETSDLSPEFEVLIKDMRSRIQDEFGLRIPGINFRQIEDINVPTDTYIIRFAETQFASGQISPDKRFFPGKQEEIAALQIAAEEVKNSPIGFVGYWIDKADWEKAEKGGAHLWEVGEYPLRHLEMVIRGYLAEFLDF